MFDCERDRQEQYFRYPQPTRAQQELLGQYTDSRSLEFVAYQLAAESSARYLYTSPMRFTAKRFNTDCELHEWVATQVDQAGLWMEFGVATGRTIRHFAEHTDHIVGFDTFTGLPEQWRPEFEAGHFAQELPAVPEGVELVEGLIEHTLGDYLERWADPVAFVHIDTDIYSAAHYTLNKLARENRLQTGTIILFDEYFNHPTWEQDEYLAWKVICDRYNIEYDYIAYNDRHQQVAVRITSLGELDETN